MDKLDLKILNSLLHNSRAPLTSIGKEVRLSRENVHYRIKRLVETGVIRDFITSINYEALGFQQFVIFLELNKIDKKSEKTLISKLLKTNNISWIGILSGKWSLTFDIFAKDAAGCNVILTDILEAFEENIGEYRVLTLQDSNFFFNKILGETNSSLKNTSSVVKALDSTDKKILAILNQDARTSYVDFSEKMSLTANAIKGRIKNLQSTGIIQSYSVSINHRKFGLEWHGVQLKLSKPSCLVERELKSFFVADTRVAFYYHYNKTGMYDFDIGIIVKNSEELRDFVNNLRTKFYEKVRVECSFIVLEEISSHNLPQILFE